MQYEIVKGKKKKIPCAIQKPRARKISTERLDSLVSFLAAADFQSFCRPFIYLSFLFVTHQKGKKRRKKKKGPCDVLPIVRLWCLTRWHEAPGLFLF